VKNFFLNIFFDNSKQIKQKAISICTDIDSKKISKSKIDEIYDQSKINEKSKNVQKYIKEQNKDFIKYVKNIYSENPIHPWIRLFSAMNQKFADFNTIPVYKFLNKTYKNEKNQLKNNIQGSLVLQKNEEKSLNSLESLSNKIVNDFGKENEYLMADLENKLENTKKSDSLDKDYYRLLGVLKSIFKQIENDINMVPEFIVESFENNLDKIIKEKINPKISQIIFSSKINSFIGFLSENYSLNIPLMFEFGLIHGLIKDPKNLEVPVKFDFMDMGNYSVGKKTLLI
jgi:hypothetical protein